MIPGICNVCQMTLFGNEARSHIARCVEARYGIRGTRDALKGRSRTVHISVGSPDRPHWMELGVRADTTLREFDRFLRSVWLECCGHLSHFDIGGVVYSMMVPRPQDDFEFWPMDEQEEQWRHMGRTVGTAIRPATWFEHQFDYGTTTDLELRHAGEFEGLVPGAQSDATLAREKDRHTCQEPSPPSVPPVRTPCPVEARSRDVRRRWGRVGRRGRTLLPGRRWISPLG